MGLFGSPKASSISGNKIYCFFLPRKKAGALPCAGHEQSVVCLRSPDTVNTLTFGWSHGSRICESLSPCFYSTNIPPSEIVSPLAIGFPIFPRFCSTFPNFFHFIRFSMRIIASASCLPVYHYNLLLAILFTQIFDILTVVWLSPAFVRC